ncbi:hypothetical protein PV327_010442 [Microctonus hyperodae]|uniref:Uncharacterized protein n=1 Tax=Microctonus hyperodae TaxID=165561 RepID=A0AA39FRX9_MICHY|nr:hypothetical protein PV327_010442 [Microctonus hyperodae]
MPIYFVLYKKTHDVAAIAHTNIIDSGCLYFSHSQRTTIQPRDKAHRVTGAAVVVCYSPSHTHTHTSYYPSSPPHQHFMYKEAHKVRHICHAISIHKLWIIASKTEMK